MDTQSNSTEDIQNDELTDTDLESAAGGVGGIGVIVLGPLAGAIAKSMEEGDGSQEGS